MPEPYFGRQATVLSTNLLESRITMATTSSTSASESSAERTPLSRDRVLEAAVEIADAGGIGSLTIRSLAQALGVKPMSVYHHVANKEQILDGIVDIVFAEIELPSPDGEWRGRERRGRRAARRALRRPPPAARRPGGRAQPPPAPLPRPPPH